MTAADRVAGLRGAVHVLEDDPEDRRAAPTQRRARQGVPGREPPRRGAAAHRDIRPQRS